MSHYSTLGVEKEAPISTIKKAFKVKAGKLHPDREGGDEAEFKKLQKAYEVLSDPVKRARYDNGEEPGRVLPHHQAQMELASLFAAVLNDPNAPSNPLVAMINHIQRNIQGLESTQKAVYKKRKRLLLNKHCLTVHGDFDILGNVIQAQRKANISQYRNNKYALAVMVAMRELIDGYEYTPPVKTSVPPLRAGFSYRDGITTGSSTTTFSI